MSDPSQDSAELFRRSWSRLEQVIEQFEEAWQSGQRPAIDEYLHRQDIEPRKLLVELAHADLECRLKAGEAVRVEAYLERYSELATDRQAALGLITTEFNVRRRREPGLGLEEYAQRFPQFRADLAERLRGPHPSAGRGPLVGTGESGISPASKFPRLGQFELLETVGEGAFGTVYRARDTELNRIVAIKVPRPDRSLTSDDVDRFVREARNAAQLSHPGIVPVYEVGRDSAVPYIVSAYIEGATLAQTMSDQRLDFRQSAEVMAQVAEALDHAHVHGVVHRDLKPSNIMLGRIEGSGIRHQESGTRSRASGVEGHDPLSKDRGLLACGSRAFVMDFGLAHRDEGEIRMTLEGQILGTPAYMSPEQARGQSNRVDGRGDIYSAGVILYEMLTGELPFRGVARMVLQQILNDEPRPLRKLNDKIPRDLETIALKCLAKEPGRRYATGAALAADLRRHLGGVPILARPVSPLERGWRWAKRNPRVAGLSAVVAVLLVAVTVGSAAASIIVSRQRDEIGIQRDAAVTAQEQAQQSAESARKHLELTLETLSKLVNQVQEELRDQPALADLSEKLLQEALEGLQRVTDITKNADTDPIMMSAHLKLGDIFYQLGRVTDSNQQYALCLAIQDHLPDSDRLQTKQQVTRCVVLTGLGKSYLRSNNVLKAQEFAEKAVTIAASILGELDPHQPFDKPELASAYSFRGYVNEHREEMKSAIESYEIAVMLAKKALDADPKQFESQHRLALMYESLGDAHVSARNLAAAQTAFDRCLELRRAMLAAQPENARAKRQVAVALERMGSMAMAKEDLPRAQDWYSKASALYVELAAVAPKNSLTQRELAVSLGQLGQVAEKRNDSQAALSFFERALERFGYLADAFPANGRFRRDRAVAHEKLAGVNRRLGNVARAGEHFTQAVKEFEAIAAMDPQNVLARVDLAGLWGYMADAEIAARDFAQGAHYLEGGIAVLREIEAQGKLKEKTHYRDWLPKMRLELEFCKTAEKLIELITKKHYAELTMAAVKLHEGAGKDPDVLFDVAALLAFCAKSLAPDKEAKQLTQEVKTAQMNLKDRAAQALKDALTEGFDDVARLNTSSDIQMLAQTSAYQELMARLKEHR
jgi:serine/threonine protein kinase/tetratricopeptide (TPR) repeat protein